ncbi:MAG: DinB family protein [Chloroflexota bacterium]
MKDTEEAALAVLESTPNILRELLGWLPESIVAADLDRGWSPKRLLAHMVDVESPAFADRLHAIVEQDEPTLTSIDAMAQLDDMGWESMSIGALLGQLERARTDTCRWIVGLADAQLQRKARHDTAGELTASNLLHYWATHDIAHLRGVQRMLNSVIVHETAGISENMDV